MFSFPVDGIPPGSNGLFDETNYGVSTGVSPPPDVTLLSGVSAVAVVLDVDSGAAVSVVVSVEVSTSVGASGVQPNEQINASAAHRLRTLLTGKLSDWQETFGRTFILMANARFARGLFLNSRIGV